MSDIPVPRSYNQIVGEMVDALISRLGLKSLYVGSAALSIIEAAAQSDVRSSQDLFEFLNSQSLDRAAGTALARIGAEEGLQQFSPAAATGQITVTDTSFTKIATVVYQGLAAPIAGSTTLAVEDATNFPASGSIYIGRGTSNYEGPINYTSKTNAGNYWTLTLSTPTARFHNLAETVILGQGGNRTVTAGTTASTAEGGLGVSIQVTTLFESVLLDGEDVLTAIPVAAIEPGSVGNVPAQGIVRFVTSPFNGASVTNPLPLGGGRDTETIEQFRERIRAARASRTKGTALAIEQGVVGAVSTDENKRIVSAALVVQEGTPATLYIDDGSGYEEKTEGVAFEVLTESATGGERYFSLQNRAVTKAFVTSQQSGPFNLADFADLAVLIGGRLSTHQFSASDFNSISGASALEVVGSINKNPSLLFSARTANEGRSVVLFARDTESNEDLQVVGGAANSVLKFSTQLANTIWLYKDDVLLSKDGQPAILVTKNQSEWPSLSSGASLNISVDNIAIVVTINDSDFINLTGFTSVANTNSLASWATVFNAKIPGITTTVSEGRLLLTSNRGNRSDASVAVSGGTLAAIFNQTSATGRDSDFTLDRNLGQIRLARQLVVGERLTVASFATRSFAETAEFSTVTVAADPTTVSGQTGAELWAIVDSPVTIIPTAVGPGLSIQVLSAAVESWGTRVRYQSTTSVFEGVLVGDLLFALDSGLALNNRGAFRVVRVDPLWVEIERATGSFTPETVALANGLLTFVRAKTYPQRVFLPSSSNPYTPTSLANAIGPQLTGATAAVYRTRRCRVQTNTFGPEGLFAFVAGNGAGSALFELTSNSASGIAHLASKLSQKETAFPTFYPVRVSSPISTTSVNFTTPAGVDGVIEPGLSIVVPETLDTVASFTSASARRWGQAGFSSPVESRSAGAVVLRNAVRSSWLAGDRLYQVANFQLSARDSLGIVVDRDQSSGRFVPNTYRRLKPTTNTYGATNTFVDSDNGNLALGLAFGTSFDWTDFAVHMKARVVASGILWRYYRHGKEGNYARLAYSYPSAPNSPVQLTATTLSSESTFKINVALESGAARATSFRSTSRVGSALISANTRADVFSLAVSAGSRTIRLDYSSGSGSRTGTVTGALSGATATVVTDGGTFVQISGVTGTFQNLETLNFGGGGTATATGSQYGLTVLTLTLPATTPAITNHGFVAGNTVWLQSTDVNFVTGPKILTASTATTITYRDTAVITGSIAGSLTISADSAGEVTLAGSGYIVGDVWSRSGLGYKTRTIVDRHLTYNTTETSPTSTTLTWSNLTAPALFPLGTNSTATITSVVNATANTPVTGTVVTPGNVVWATYEPESLGFSTPFHTFNDGLNYVRSQSVSVNDYTFTFKESVTGALATNSDWINEEVRIVPVTTKNAIAFLGSLATSGVGSRAEVISAGEGVQITTSTIGSEGVVDVEGGLANETTVDVIGTPVTDTLGGDVTAVQVSSSQAAGLTGGQFVYVENQTAAPKTIFANTTSLTLSSTGELLLTGTRAWKYPSDGADGLFVDRTLKVEKHGKVVAYIFDNTASIPPTSLVSGDWFVAGVERVDPTFTAVGTLTAANRGIFRVVAAFTSAFWGTTVVWVENPNAVEEIANASFVFVDEDSLLPGDKVVVSTDLLGTANAGEWTVSRIDRTDRQRIFLSTASRAPVGVGPVTLGSSSQLLQVYGEPMKVLGRIGSISPFSSTTSLVKFTDLRLDLGLSIAVAYNATLKRALIGSNYGSQIKVLGKLGLDLSESQGVDGYSKYTGIIEEANKIVYGFASESSTYPGIAAAGAQININGPLLRRLQIALGIRPQSSVSIDGLIREIQAAVASYVESVAVGQPVSIGEIVAAAQQIDGVLSVAVISPSYNETSDIIPIQPYEKAKIVDPNQDVVVNLIGE